MIIQGMSLRIDHIDGCKFHYRTKKIQYYKYDWISACCSKSKRFPYQHLERFFGGNLRPPAARDYIRGLVAKRSIYLLFCQKLHNSCQATPSETIRDPLKVNRVSGSNICNHLWIEKFKSNFCRNRQYCAGIRSHTE
jgi:hypothetical protein